MSFTADTFYTLIRKGLRTKSGEVIQANRYQRTEYPPSQIKDFSLTFTPILFLGDRSSVYSTAFNEKIYECPEIVTESEDPSFVPNAASVYYRKSANTSMGGFEICDSLGNTLSSEISNFPNGRPCEILDEQSGNWVVDNTMELSICLMCLQDGFGTPISAGFGLVQAITGDSKSYGPGTGNPGQEIIAQWDYIGQISTDAQFMAMLDAWLYGDYYEPGGNSGKPDPNPNGSDGGGGDGQWPNHSISVPGLPTKSAASAGFIRVYNITEAELNDLASELWDPSFWNTIVKNFQSPFENIVSLGLVPYGGMVGAVESVQIGNYKSSVSALALSNVYYELDCGNVTFHEAWGMGNFLDFEPHLRLQVFCPYCGMVDVSPSEFMYKTMNIKYHLDVFSGACVAYISVIDEEGIRVLYQKEGNIKAEVPINSQNYTNVYNNSIGAVFALAGAGLGVIGASTLGGGAGLTGLTIAGAGLSVAKTASNLASIKPDYQRSGNIGGMHGIMGIQTPYVICTLPKSIEAPNYKKLHGYPSGKRVRVGDMTGFLQSGANYNDLETIPCTTDEMDMIIKALNEGIQI